MSTLITKDNFEKEVKESTLPVLLRFTAPWCSPCRAIEPIVNTAEKEHGQFIKFCKVDCDESPGIANLFNVIGIPTIVFIKDGVEVKRVVGNNSSELIKTIKEMSTKPTPL